MARSQFQTAEQEYVFDDIKDDLEENRRFLADLKVNCDNTKKELAYGNMMCHMINGELHLLDCEGFTVAKVIVRSALRVVHKLLFQWAHASTCFCVHVLVQLMNECSGRCWYVFDSVYALFVCLYVRLRVFACALLSLNSVRM